MHKKFIQKSPRTAGTFLSQGLSQWGQVPRLILCNESRDPLSVIKPPGVLFLQGFQGVVGVVAVRKLQAMPLRDL